MAGFDDDPSPVNHPRHDSRLAIVYELLVSVKNIMPMVREDHSSQCMVTLNFRFNLNHDTKWSKWKHGVRD